MDTTLITQPEQIDEQAEHVEAPVEIVAEESTSIDDHAAKFGRQKVEQQAQTPQQQTDRQPHHSDTQRREKTGEFAEGHKRQRQSKNPAQRIGELTGRAKTAEERVTQLEAEVERLKAQGAPRQQVQQAQQRVETAQSTQAQTVAGDAEPKESDPKYNGNYLAYLDDRSRWVARQEWKAQQDRQQQEQRTREQQMRAQEVTKNWAERVEAARAKYPDFDTVAFAPTPIQPGTVVDAWIMEHKAGADVLHYLQSHRQELDALLAKPVLQQAEDLALLSQRFASNPSGMAGDTGSVARRNVVVLPKPPNPVRTEAQSVGQTPPPTDGSLSIADHAKHFAPQSRR